MRGRVRARENRGRGREEEKGRVGREAAGRPAGDPSLPEGGVGERKREREERGGVV